MCNAWNHSLDCQCGFGGDGHLGSGGYSGYATLWLHGATAQFAPFPNCIRALAQRYQQTITLPTKCRYCGAEVFVYANEHGSFVIFDQLGLPWPKHDCPNYSSAIQDQIMISGDCASVFTGEDLVHYSEIERQILYSGQIFKTKIDGYSGPIRGILEKALKFLNRSCLVVPIASETIRTSTGIQQPLF